MHRRGAPTEDRDREVAVMGGAAGATAAVLLEIDRHQHFRTHAVRAGA